MDSKPNVSIYVADFAQMAWLNAGLFPPGYNQMEKTGVSDNTITDRVVKLYVEFGHPIDDYRYYEEYLLYYDGYLKGYKSKPRHHQPYIDLRFWDNGCGSIAELFEKNVREAAEQSRIDEETKYVDALKAEWKGHNNAVLKMVTTSIFYLLDKHKETGILASKMSDSVKFFKEIKKGSKLTGFRFDTTKDFIHHHDRQSYIPNGKTIDLVLGNEYHNSDIKKFYDYIDFWFKVLSEIELDEECAKEALVETWDLAYGLLVRETEFISEFWDKYDLPKDEDSSNSNMDWKKMIKDFLLVFRKN